jgi:hypothetical protein
MQNTRNAVSYLSMNIKMHKDNNRECGVTPVMKLSRVQWRLIVEGVAISRRYHQISQPRTSDLGKPDSWSLERDHVSDDFRMEMTNLQQDSMQNLCFLTKSPCSGGASA